jgi:CxxC-x17-CxxC domain-containing protein
MEHNDRSLICRDCGSEFTFTSGEQEFYSEKGFNNEPKRCPSCRKNRKRNGREDRGRKKSFEVVCSNCGADTEVPFEPKAGRPVYCKACFDNKRD